MFFFFFEEEEKYNRKHKNYEIKFKIFIDIIQEIYLNLFNLSEIS